jgi:hypothetical protein
MLIKANKFLSANQALNSSRKVDANRIQQRCQIVTLNHCGVNPRTIGWFVNHHISTVRKWILCAKDGDDLCDKK